MPKPQLKVKRGKQWSWPLGFTKKTNDSSHILTRMASGLWWHNRGAEGRGVWVCLFNRFYFRYKDSSNAIDLVMASMGAERTAAEVYLNLIEFPQDRRIIKMFLFLFLRKENQCKLDRCLYTRG